LIAVGFIFFFSSRRRHTRCLSDWSSDVCSSDLTMADTHYKRRRSTSTSRQVPSWQALTAPAASPGQSQFPAATPAWRLVATVYRSEERRVGKEGRMLVWWEDEEKKEEQ